VKRTAIYRVSLVREGSLLYEPAIRQSDQAARLFRAAIPDDQREHFWALFLDTRNRVIGSTEISVGSLTSSLVHPREAFRAGIALAASAILFGHNHPSGDPAPSREDADLTRRLWEAGKILGIRVLDHIIIGDCGDPDPPRFSFADSGEFPPS
jgi:DNA repair protein RadC